MRFTVPLFVLILFSTQVHSDEQKPESGVGGSEARLDAESPVPVTKLNKASELIGAEVRNPQNERLGEIKDLMLSLRNDRIVYAVLGTGGFLGIRDKLIALPPNALEISSDQKHLILHADKESLRAAPSFENNNWPQVADTKWVAEAEQHYARQTGQSIEEAAGSERKKKKQPDAAAPKGEAQEPAATRYEAPPNLRASELIRMTVKNPQGQRLGDIKDMSVNLPNGKIRYLVVSTGGLIGVGEKLFAIPPQSFQKSEEQKTLLLDASKEVFQAAVGFNRNAWPEVADKSFVIGIRDPAGSPRDPGSDGRTALDQSNTRRDLMITQQLRRAIMADETMSVLTRNITIITADGRITVRGTVASQKEVDRIVAFAREIAGNEVTNELTIQNKQGGKNDTAEPKKN